jgi:hypothetical protein
MSITLSGRCDECMLGRGFLGHLYTSEPEACWSVLCVQVCLGGLVMCRACCLKEANLEVALGVSGPDELGVSCCSAGQ